MKFSYLEETRFKIYINFKVNIAKINFSFTIFQISSKNSKISSIYVLIE